MSTHSPQVAVAKKILRAERAKERAKKRAAEIARIERIQELHEKVPFPTDEKSYKFDFNGRHEGDTVKLEPWSMCFPVKNSINIKKNLLKDLEMYDLNSKDLPKKISNFLGNFATLKIYSKRADNENRKMGQPLCVQVVGKKILRTVLIPKEFNNYKIDLVDLFGILLVADSTGYCELKVFNDGIACVYDKVKIGDTLLIGEGWYQSYTPPPPPSIPSTSTQNQSARPAGAEPEGAGGILFPPPFALPKYFDKLKLKITQYQSRHLFKIGRESNPNALEKFPEYLFKIGETENIKELFTSSKIVKELNYEFPEGYETINLVGVVSYVGRMQRSFCAKPNPKLENRADLKQYCLTRWISVIDQFGEEVKILLFINYDSINFQFKLTPLTNIVMTHLKLSEYSKLTQPHLVTTFYTNIIIDNEVSRFLELMPQSYTDVVENEGIFKNNFYQNLKGRVGDEKFGVLFTLGGTIRLKFDPEETLRCFKEGVIEERPIESLNKIPEQITRRESATLIFKGKLIYTKFDVIRAVRDENGDNLFSLPGRVNVKYSPYNWVNFRRIPDFPLKDWGNEEKARKVNKSHLVKLSRMLNLPPRDDGGILKNEEKFDGKKIGYIKILNPEDMRVYWTTVLDGDEELQQKLYESICDYYLDPCWLFVLNVYCVEMVEGEPSFEIILNNLIRIPPETKELEENHQNSENSEMTNNTESQSNSSYATCPEPELPLQDLASNLNSQENENDIELADTENYNAPTDLPVHDQDQISDSNSHSQEDEDGDGDIEMADTENFVDVDPGSQGSDFAKFLQFKI